MSWLYRYLIRPALFAQEAELVHDRTMRLLTWASRHESICGPVESFLGAPDLPSEFFGLRFPNPIGLAAGMDKHALAVPVWEALGFGFTELGGVTWEPQPGNPVPRLFRAVSEEAIVNRFGFNNPGAETVAGRLRAWRDSGRWPSHPIGINLGKSKVTALEKAPEDYARSFRVLLPCADFFVVNVSSPNTPNLRQLQDKTLLDEILAALQEVQHASNLLRPILVKVAPDLSFEALDEILELTRTRALAGIVATNTTITRPETSDPQAKKIYAETGGLSGRPLRQRSTEVVRHLYRQTNGKLPIVGVGGIFDASDAWEKITAGASLLQIYTALVYRGPGVAKSIVNGLLERLEAHGLTKISQAVGLAHTAQQGKIKR